MAFRVAPALRGARSRFRWGSLLFKLTRRVLTINQLNATKRARLRSRTQKYATAVFWPPGYKVN